MKPVLELPRALAARLPALSLSALALCTLGCSPELERLPQRRSARDSLGQEIYKVLCRRVAAIEMPTDLSGQSSEQLCLADSEDARAELDEQRGALPARLVALAERRDTIAAALDATFTEEQAESLEQLMRELLPFYDPPEEHMQASSRALARVLSQLAADDEALVGLSRFAREGMVASEGVGGVLRGLLGDRGAVSALGKVLKPLTQDGALASSFRAALDGMALELATSELEAEPGSDTCRLRELLLRRESPGDGEPQFAQGAPLYSLLRDVRGMPVPARASGPLGLDATSACGVGSAPRVPVPFPFVDDDGDGFADVKSARFKLASGAPESLPEPFPAPAEGETSRDPAGRAHGLSADGSANPDALLYETVDVNGSVLAAAVRESVHAFEETSLLSSLAGALPALLGETRSTERQYGNMTHRYDAPNPEQSPAIELVHALGVLLDDPIYDASLELTLRLLREHEPEMMHAIQPLLRLEQRTRPGSDAYPDAKLEANNTLWDEVLFELEKLSRQRGTVGGESTLHAIAEAMLGLGRNFSKPGAPFERVIDPRLLAHQGALMATMLRFKDEWRANPVGKSDRQAGEPGVIGGFRTPVDRNQPDAPISCGRDGCAGEIVGSPFERWKKPGQNCVIQRPGRPASGKDCGQPSNQSLFQRSMGMLAEMDGRSQCNRPILVDDLFDFAAKDAAQEDPIERQRTIADAENALANDYTCPDDPGAACRQYADKYPAAFVDPDGAGAKKPAIQACALLDVKDVGRTFGKVLTHQYQLEIPNPWVRRYLEDVARAADPRLEVCAAGTITDPSSTPDCVPDAAKLSRNMFDELLECFPEDEGCVDTLGELVEFLLDDDTLFRNDQDAIALRPDARALSRVMFAPAGSTSTFELFEPLLVRGAPSICGPGQQNACVDDNVEPAPGSCCIRDPMAPPLRYRLDTYYGSTTFAWEQPFKLSDGTSLTFLDAMAPIADAFNRIDEQLAGNAEDPRYGLTVLGTVVAAHYDSPANPAVQNERPDAPGYRKLTALVRYEEMLADLLDDGSIDLAQTGPAGQPLFDASRSYESDQQLGVLLHGVDLLEALYALDFHGRTGLDASIRVAERWLNPHATCAGPDGDDRVRAGRGACHVSALPAPVRARDGRDFVCWNDGACFDGAEGREKRFVSALNLVLDALRQVRTRSSQDESQRVAARMIPAALLDGFVRTENGRLASRRGRALLLTLGDYMRERWAEERDAGKLSDWNARTTDDAIEALTNPALAGVLGVLHGLSKQEGALSSVAAWLRGALDEQRQPQLTRALILAASDMVHSLPGDSYANALLRRLADAAAPNVRDVLAGAGQPLASGESLLFTNAFVLGETAARDTRDALGTVMRNALGASLASGDSNVPLTLLTDALLDVNRANPARSGVHDPADYRAAFTRMADVLLDERRGFERLYKVVQCATSLSGSTSCD